MDKVVKNGAEEFLEYVKENNPEGYKNICEVMEKSNGVVNNMFCAILALSGKHKVDDIINMGNTLEKFFTEEKSNDYKNAIPYYFNNFSCNGVFDTNSKHSSFSGWHKQERRDNNARRFKFKDTFVYRALVKYGLDKGVSKWEKEREFDTNDTYRRHWTNDGTIIDSMMMYYNTPKDLRDKISKDENLSELWARQAHIQKEVPHWKRSRYGSCASKNITVSDSEWRKFQTENIVREFDWLANSDDEVGKLKKNLEEKNSKEERYWYRREFSQVVIFGNAIRQGFRDAYSDKSMALIEDMYKAIDYLGIGVIADNIVTRDYNCGYKASAIATKIAGCVRRFVIDVKKGYEVEDVRELIVEDLNKWFKEKVRGQWKAYVRTDAPKQYPDIPVKGKKKATTTSSELPLGFEQAIEKFNNKEKEKE